MLHTRPRPCMCHNLVGLVEGHAQHMRDASLRGLQEFVAKLLALLGSSARRQHSALRELLSQVTVDLRLAKECLERLGTRTLTFTLTWRRVALVTALFRTGGWMRFASIRAQCWQGQHCVHCNSACGSCSHSHDPSSHSHARGAHGCQREVACREAGRTAGMPRVQCDEQRAGGAEGGGATCGYCAACVPA
jgi:hypothetical protein